MITHQVYLNGKLTRRGSTHVPGVVQSLTFKDHTGRDVSVGVVEPEKYNFGVAKRREEIHVVSGEIFAHGIKFTSNSNAPIIFNIGEAIEFYVEGGPASYRCIYG